MDRMVPEPRTFKELVEADPHDGDERGERYGKVVKHISSEERGWVAGGALLSTAHMSEPRVQCFFLALLLRHECAQ